MLIIGIDKMATDYVDTVDTILNIDIRYADRLLILAFLVIVIITFIGNILERRSINNVVNQKHLTQDVTIIVLGFVLTLIIFTCSTAEDIVDDRNFYDYVTFVLFISVISGLVLNILIRGTRKYCINKSEESDNKNQNDGPISKRKTIVSVLWTLLPGWINIILFGLIFYTIFKLCWCNTLNIISIFLFICGIKAALDVIAIMRWRKEMGFPAWPGPMKDIPPKMQGCEKSVLSGLLVISLGWVAVLCIGLGACVLFESARKSVFIPFSVFLIVCGAKIILDLTTLMYWRKNKS